MNQGVFAIGFGSLLAVDGPSKGGEIKLDNSNKAASSFVAKPSSIEPLASGPNALSPRTFALAQEGPSIPSEPKSDALDINKAGGQDAELYSPEEPLCFVVGCGIDAAHTEFEKGQILELSNPDGDATPVLQKASYRIPRPIPEENVSKYTHETGVASVVGGRRCGVYPGVRIVDVRMKRNDHLKYDNGEIERRLGHVLAFLKADPKVPAVVNMSIGGSETDNSDSWHGCKCREEWLYPKSISRSPPIDDIIKEMNHCGALFIASADNNSVPAYTSWPASNPYALIVGALDENGDLPPFSNFGGAVGLYAPGVQVRVGDIAPKGYTQSDGTSFAAPYIAGYACMSLDRADEFVGLQTPELRPGALKSMLYDRFYLWQYARVPLDKKTFRKVSDEELANDAGDDQYGEGEPPKEEPPKEEPPKEEPPKEEPPKEESPKEEPPREDPPKEDPTDKDSSECT